MHQPLDLVGALVDLRDLGVAHHPLDGVLVDVAVAAQHLDGVGGHLHGRVAGEELGERGEMGDLGRVVVDQLRGVVDHRPGGGGLRLHVGDHELDRLELGDRLAELLCARARSPTA